MVVVGPTASGKSAVACEIARRIPSEIISCDSMQVYKSMPILTGLGAALGSDPKVHLVSFLPPTKEYNAAQFRKDALLKIEMIAKKGKVPILVGGTGLYLRALLDGLFEDEDGGPIGKDEKLRMRLADEASKKGSAFLYEKLNQVDPFSAAKIHPNDTRRMIRALEVFYLTGRPFSEQKTRRRGIRGQWPCAIYLLDRDRADLYERIEKRVDEMVKQGLVGEVKALQKKKLSLTAAGALGIREIGGYLKGEMSLSQAIALLKRNTRRYAKRQLSWFRHEKGVEKIPVENDDSVTAITGRIIKRWKSAS